MTTDATRPSLVEPDFSGMWSVARLGHEKKWWSKFMGSIALSMYIYSWMGGLASPLFILVLVYKQYFMVSALVISILALSSLLPIEPQPWICRFYMKYGAHYFDGGSSMCFEKKPDCADNEQPAPIVVPAHPHGMFAIGYWLASGVRFRAVQDIHDEKVKEEYVGHGAFEFWRNKPPRLGLVVDILIYTPVLNLLVIRLTGCMAAVSSQSMKKIMKTGTNFGFLPGGFDEATIYRKGENVIYIRNRKGFIKYCLQYGYRICPAYFFGECETYNNLFYSHPDNQLMTKIKNWFNKNKIPTVLPMGPYWFSPFLPFGDTGIHVVYSANTRCEHIENPTKQQIDECHQWYMNEISALFDRHKW
eukprot:CAMPEP_0197075648 /NCGR_PEP_ID=MMETSP1384-20130603/211718_1 /TAXON_ID=29189 /ORGANISM="Ammonia sp." /LENGTH=359 /DNA_ID=CAMNT_0042514497 /DNA_START=49 /DNA_END=1125 /DNA_ORIENTATION=+